MTKRSRNVEQIFAQQKQKTEITEKQTEKVGQFGTACPDPDRRPGATGIEPRTCAEPPAPPGSSWDLTCPATLQVEAVGVGSGHMTKPLFPVTPPVRFHPSNQVGTSPGFTVGPGTAETPPTPFDPPSFPYRPRPPQPQPHLSAWSG